jgi:8-oxo-dGTP pyrophosphatase MutT (NUDIX family)
MPDRVNLVSDRVASVERTATDLVDRVFRAAMVLLVTAIAGVGIVLMIRRRQTS